MGAPHATLTTLSFYFLLIGTPGSRKEVGHPATKKKFSKKQKGPVSQRRLFLLQRHPTFHSLLVFFNFLVCCLRAFFFPPKSSRPPVPFLRGRSPPLRLPFFVACVLCGAVLRADQRRKALVALKKKLRAAPGQRGEKRVCAKDGRAARFSAGLS